MDRSRLVQLAPQYYMIPICDYLSKSDALVSSSELLTLDGMINVPTFHAALSDLVKQQLLFVIWDDFGPNIYVKTDKFDEKCEELQRQLGTPFYKWSILTDRDMWLNSALANLNKVLGAENIDQRDFENPEAEWEPLPVERSNEKLQAATRKLDETIEAIEADNGYNANYPEEKALVVDSLKVASEKINKDNHIAFAYIRRMILEPLGTVIVRFGRGTLGLLAQATRAAFLDWLKEITSQLLHLLH
jgi:hypothetical protein